MIFDFFVLDEFLKIDKDCWCSWAKLREEWTLILEKIERKLRGVFESEWSYERNSDFLNIYSLQLGLGFKFGLGFVFSVLANLMHNVSTKYHVIISAESRLDLNIKIEACEIFNMVPKERAQSDKRRESYEFFNAYWHIAELANADFSQLISPFSLERMPRTKTLISKSELGVWRKFVANIICETFPKEPSRYNENRRSYDFYKY